jgi:hypothetical protein
MRHDFISLRENENARLITMLQVSMVHAEPDAALAQDFGSYLERNCLVQTEYQLVTDGRPLMDVVPRALACDVLILFVSPHSVPRRLDRSQWEPLFIETAHEHGTHIGYVHIAECPFPKVLLRNNTFDSGRALKRWIFDLRPATERPDFVPDRPVAEVAGEPMESLWQSIADRPGTATMASRDLAHAFASQSRADFQGVFWVECRGATVACAAGDLGAQLGLVLDGEIAVNLARIRDLCNRYRCLVILAGATAEVANALGALGRTSVLLTGDPPASSLSVEIAKEHFEALSTWVKNANRVPPSGQIHETVQWLAGPQQDWTLACQFSRAAIAYYKFHQRFAEAYELAEMMTKHAIQRRDREAANEFGEERGWILEGWGLPAEAVHPFAMEREPAVQLGLWQ